MVQPFNRAISSTALRKPEFADTPPDKAISLIFKSLLALMSLSIKMSTIVACKEAHKSAR